MIRIQFGTNETEHAVLHFYLKFYEMHSMHLNQLKKRESF